MQTKKRKRSTPSEYQSLDIDLSVFDTISQPNGGIQYRAYYAGIVYHLWAGL